MPVSAYIQAALFVLLNAVALFAAAGTVEIFGFWVSVSYTHLDVYKRQLQYLRAAGVQ